MSLKDLDDRLLPALGRALDKVLPRPLPEPTGPAPFIVRLRRVDDRWAAKGPLALFREIPQLGALVLTALLAVNAGTLMLRALHRTPAAESQRDPAGEPPPDAVGGHLGPDLGENVAAYVKAATTRLRGKAVGAPDGTAVAVVSFTSYRTPEQVDNLLGPLGARRVYYRVPVKLPGTAAIGIPVTDLIKDTRADFAKTARRLLGDAKALEAVDKTFNNDPEQKASNEADARLFRREAAILRGPCACVFGVVVRAPLRLLVDLLAMPGVRAVDASGPGARLDDFSFTALLPEDKTVVTGGNQASG